MIDHHRLVALNRTVIDRFDKHRLRRPTATAVGDKGQCQRVAVVAIECCGELSSVGIGVAAAILAG